MVTRKTNDTHESLSLAVDFESLVRVDKKGIRLEMPTTLLNKGTFCCLTKLCVCVCENPFEPTKKHHSTISSTAR